MTVAMRMAMSMMVVMMPMFMTMALLFSNAIFSLFNIFRYDSKNLCTLCSGSFHDIKLVFKTLQFVLKILKRYRICGKVVFEKILKKRINMILQLRIM
jgi:hypothetical protein